MKDVGTSLALIFAVSQKEELCLVQMKTDHLHGGIMKDEDFLWFNLSFYVFSLKDQNASSGLFIF